MHRAFTIVLMFMLKNVCRASSSRRTAFVTPPARAVSLLSSRSNVVELPQRQQQQQLSSNQHHQLPITTTTWIMSRPNCCTPRGTDPIRRFSSSSGGDDDNDENVADSIFAKEPDFASMGVQSPVLLQRLKEIMGFTLPTAVQSAAYKLIRDSQQQDVTIGAETGSGKTLAYLIPLMDDILERKSKSEKNGGDIGYDYARALILVPNKELVQQVVRMAVPLAGGQSSLIYGGSTLSDPSILGHYTGDENVKETERVRLAIFPGGLKEPMGFRPFRKTLALGGSEPPIDLIIATPATVGPLGLSPKNIEMFADIPTLVIDEADMLLDGGYIRQLENVLMGFRRADRIESTLGVSKTQHVFVAATLPDYGLRSVDAYLKKKFPQTVRVTLAGMHQARHSGLAQQTLWLPEESKQSRMKHLVQLLGEPVEEGGLQGEKVMVFLNSVEDVEGASEALLRAGQMALPYHAKIPLEERTKTLDRFRRYDKANSSSGETSDSKNDSVQILVCTDLAARGIDVPNVDAVVQLQFAGNVVGHLHRMGRCGRAGQKTGRGIVFYDEVVEGPLIKVVREAETQQERMVLEGAEVVDLDEESEEIAEEFVAGSVKKAFSRKRAFTKKRKKLLKEATPES